MLDAKPASFLVKVSADNRYKLYVNGMLVSAGPARGDTYYWNYETVDLAPYLMAGKNVVGAIVWNDAEYRPEAQISLRELVQLSPGDIIPIEPPQDVTLLAGDVPLYQGRFGVSQGRNALKILPGGPA